MNERHSEKLPHRTQKLLHGSLLVIH
jgi:hypothetical protein